MAGTAAARCCLSNSFLCNSAFFPFNSVLFVLLNNKPKLDLLGAIGGCSKFGALVPMFAVVPLHKEGVARLTLALEREYI